MPTTRDETLALYGAADKIAALEAELARLRSKGERMADALREIAEHSTGGGVASDEAAAYMSDLARAALAEWEGPCGRCGGSEIAKFGNGPAFDTPCPDCTKGGERG